uniref:TEA domain-containing protein n=1 Tax=Globodera rostochiensis TaxID=31243 RepID=A0A914HKP9_GLORO
MNFATATGAGGGCSTRIVDDSIDDTKPQLLNLGSLATVWPQQRQQAQQQLLGQDLLSSVVDGPLFSTNAASSTPSINANNVSNTSPQSSSSNGGGNNGTMANTPGGADGGDAEGVWSPDIDQAFHEALQIYPPCGRRKIILSDEGKMYGRNELIARYIKIRCGKTRTRKQVSSHIQVLARKKQREHQARMKVHHHHQDGQQTTDFGMSQHQQQLAPPPSTSGSISPNPGAPLGGADPSSVESNQSSGAFHHTNICTAANTNGGDILPPPFSGGGGGASGGVDDVGGGGGGGGTTSASSLTTTKAAAPNANLLLGMAPANNLTTVGQRESVVNASTMHQKMLEAASAISNSVMSSMPNPSTTNWPYSLNAQHLLGGIQMAASRPPHDLYTSILGGLQPAAVLKTESPNNGGMITTTSLPNGTSGHSSASSFAIDNFTIASSRLILCGFTAYIEQNLCGGGGGAGGMAVDGEESRVEIIKIPKISDAPLERIGLECVQSKYPELLQELFKKGPTDAFFLVKCWANMHFNFGDQHSSLFAVDSFYESSDKFDITVSTKVCSFGNEVVEKVEIYSPIDEEEEAKCSGVWHFRLEKSPMCEYMVRFISELKKLPQPSMMNSVLENFTVLQIVTDKQSNNTLMVIAFMFGVREDSNNVGEDGDDEMFTNIYRITE